MFGSASPGGARSRCGRPGGHGAARHARLRAWAAERFPLGTGLLLLPGYSAVLACARALTQPGPLRLSPVDAAGYLGALAFFLMLRVIDEHKDFRRDRADHPDRVLQRGVVTLAELRAVGMAAVPVQLAACLLADRGVGPVTLSWAVAVAWVAVSATDFFAGGWLARRPALYPVLHLPVAALACAWLAQLGACGRPLPGAAAWLAGLGPAVSATFDLIRKLAPRRGRSYAAALGPGRAAAALLVVLLAGTAVQANLLWAAVGRSVAAESLLAVAVLPAAVALAGFGRRPGPARARAAGAAAGCALLGQLGVLTGTILVRRGIG